MRLKNIKHRYWAILIIIILLIFIVVLVKKYSYKFEGMRQSTFESYEEFEQYIGADLILPDISQLDYDPVSFRNLTHRVSGEVIDYSFSFEIQDIDSEKLELSWGCYSPNENVIEEIKLYEETNYNERKIYFNNPIYVNNSNNDMSNIILEFNFFEKDNVYYVKGMFSVGTNKINEQVIQKKNNETKENILRMVKLFVDRVGGDNEKEME